MTPHIAAARRAATHVLWAACAGGSLEEANAIMLIACDLWPEPPLTVGKGCPLADSSSPEGWRRALAAMEEARAGQEQHMGIDRAKAEAVERLVSESDLLSSAQSDGGVDG